MTAPLVLLFGFGDRHDEGLHPTNQHHHHRENVGVLGVQDSIKKEMH